MVVINYIQ